MPPIALYLAVLLAAVIIVLHLVVQGIILVRSRSQENVRAWLVPFFAILLYIPSILFIAALHRRGMPLPRPRIPDPASGEDTMLAAFALVGAYAVAFALARPAASLLARRRRK